MQCNTKKRMKCYYYTQIQCIDSTTTTTTTTSTTTSATSFTSTTGTTSTTSASTSNTITTPYHIYLVVKHFTAIYSSMVVGLMIGIILLLVSEKIPRLIKQRI